MNRMARLVLGEQRLNLALQTVDDALLLHFLIASNLALRTQVTILLIIS